MSDRLPGKNPFDPAFEQLPDTLPIFPLSGVLLLPGGRLPLNVFEPRYLAMIFDSLAGHRMIGMVQPQQPGGFAGDGLPQSLIACSVALADKLDALSGLFGIGQVPTGDKDPFGLRRAAVGMIRI